MNNLVFFFCIITLQLAKTQFIENQNKDNSTSQENTRCILPQHPDHGRWIVVNGDGKPNDYVDYNTILKFECDDGYQLVPRISLFLCINGDFGSLPKCEKKCPVVVSSKNTKLTCTERDGLKISCDQATDDTYLAVRCGHYYEIPPGSKNSLVCQDGNWDFPVPICQSICGLKLATSSTDVNVAIEKTSTGKFPWVVTLYKANNNVKNVICGATLLSPTVVLTAAHCVTDLHGNVAPKEDFIMAAGKYYNAYDDPRDVMAQYRKMSKVIVSEAYKGEVQKFAGDLAVLIASEPFILSPAVQPVCITNDNNYNQMEKGDRAEFESYGFNKNYDMIDHRIHNKVVVKQMATCTHKPDKKWQDIFVWDKMCMELFQPDFHIGCGAGGSGLVLRSRKTNRYFLIGVLSASPRATTEQRTPTVHFLSTFVSDYYDFVSKNIRKYHIEDCSLPDYPKNGKWILEKNVEKQPGDIVPSTTILQFVCDEGHKLSTATQFYQCNDPYNKPTCNRLCPTLTFPVGTTTMCHNKRSQQINCEEAVDGSSITYTCPTGYITQLGTNVSTRYCLNGTYGSSKPNCVPKPASKSVLSEEVGSDGIKVICTYVSAWAYKNVTPEHFDPTLCTHVIYNHIGLWNKGDVRIQDDPLDLDQDDKGLYTRINEMKIKNKKLKVLLSVGGTTASNASIFTTVSQTLGRIGPFLGSSDYFIKTYHFDGLNIDWQYPEESEKESYIKFLENIRADFNRKGWLLSASVRPDLANTGYNPKEMNRLLDWITINSYDFYDGKSSSYTGNHNALYPSSKENQWEKEHLNIDSVAKNWIEAGIDKDKLVVSVAFHGRSFILNTTDETDIHAPINGPGPGVDEGLLRYYEICSDFVEGYTEVWDDETKTPYRYKDNVWIGFNNKDAIRIKGKYVKTNGFAGVNVYPLDGDDNKGICGEKHVLLKNLHAGLGHNVNWEKADET